MFCPCRGSLFFWRDRTREVDFLAETGNRLELFEAKWTELPGRGDTVNLRFVQATLASIQPVQGAVVSRTPNPYPLGEGFHAIPVTEL